MASADARRLITDECGTAPPDTITRFLSGPFPPGARTAQPAPGELLPRRGGSRRPTLVISPTRVTYYTVIYDTVKTSTKWKESAGIRTQIPS